MVLPSPMQSCRYFEILHGLDQPFDLVEALLCLAVIRGGRFLSSMSPL